MPPGWKSTAKCGPQSSLKRWSAHCIWKSCVCLPGARPCWKTWATLRPTSCTTPPGLDSLSAQCENLLVVSNEVFSGGADYAGDTDRYLRALAQVNNAFAARADAVVRVVCGIPVYYKGVEK